MKQLSEMSGIPPHTIRDRMRRGFTIGEAVKEIPVQESVKEFSEDSYYMDWVGMTVEEVHTNYWQYCLKFGYQPLQKQGFSRQLLSMYPMLKTVPTKCGDRYYRIIRLKKG